jgi:AraC-like DNA-binding protein
MQVMHDVAQPLRHRRVFGSRNADETRAFMATKEFGLELAPREAKAFDFAANVAYMPGSYLGFVQYGAAATIHVPDIRARDDYWLHLPLRGACEITNNAGSVICAPGRAVVSSPLGHFTRSETGSSRLTVSITRATMLNQLTALLGDTPHRLLEFFPTMDLDSATGQRLMRHVQFALREMGEAEALLHPIPLVMYEQLIVTNLLLLQSNSYTNKLEGLEGRIAPRHVKRAIDFIEGHLRLPITLGDIARASGVPGRTLLEQFRNYHGVSPMRYLRDARFARAREALMHADKDDNVTRIAMIWGFCHLGRFAVEYRKRFGEAPSETHRRSRNARW